MEVRLTSSQLLSLTLISKWAPPAVEMSRDCLELSGNVSNALDDMKQQVKAMSNENIPFGTSVLSRVKGDWRKTVFTTVLVAFIVLLCGP